MFVAVASVLAQPAVAVCRMAQVRYSCQSVWAADKKVAAQAVSAFAAVCSVDQQLALPVGHTSEEL